MEQNKLNLFQKMLAIQSELNTVAKNLEVGTGSSSYKAVGEGDVLKAVKPLEAKYGVYSYPSKRTLLKQEILESQAVDYKTKQPVIKKQVFMRVETTYTFINVENPVEQISMITYGDGFDAQDKASGKAMTYSDKYALLKAYKIVTGDDPDQEASQELYSAYNEYATGVPETPKVTNQKKSNVPTFETFTPLTDVGYQQAITLDKKWQELACKRFNISSVLELSMEQLNYIISKLDGAK